MHSATEENYLKNIYLLLEKNTAAPVTTNELSEAMGIKAASVTDMLQRLSEKKLLHYKKYQGALLTQKGKEKAVEIVRKHRLWEFFLVDQLKFQWDEVHEVAEELEHVNSPVLIEKLDAFLGRPKFDPHGDPIPDQEGRVASHKFKNLSILPVNDEGKVAAVIDQQPAFLKHLDRLRIHRGTKIKVVDRVEYDQSLGIVINGTTPANISHEVAKNILVSK
jgi:DtxR family Mn-dependent transcriptional regulator